MNMNIALSILFVVGMGLAVYCLCAYLSGQSIVDVSDDECSKPINVEHNAQKYWMTIDNNGHSLFFQRLEHIRRYRHEGVKDFAAIAFSYTGNPTKAYENYQYKGTTPRAANIAKIAKNLNIEPGYFVDNQMTHVTAHAYYSNFGKK